MQTCPNCGRELSVPVRHETDRRRRTNGRNRAGAELITCPDCDELLDGFSPH